MKRRIALVAVLALALAGCAAEEGGGGGDGSCAKEDLPLVQEGVLTIGTDSPAFEPWFVDDDPANGEGFESAVAYAVYLVIGAEIAQRIGAIRFAALAVSAACLCCILQFLLLRPLSALALPKEVYGLVVIIAAVCTVIPIFMTAEALRRIGANQVAMIGAVGPVAAILFGILLLDESMNLVQTAGAGLVIGGVMLATVEARARK